MENPPHDPSPDQIYDLAVIGAGPLGIELAVAVKQAGLTYIHLEATQIGATMQWWAPGTRWFSSPERISIAGVPLITPNQEKATREEYLAYLRSVVEQFDLTINLFEPVESIIKNASGHFDVITRPASGPRVYRARRVACVTGGTAKPRLLNIPGENLPHVSHYFQDPHTYFRRDLLIVGGRNSAVEAALRCHRAGARVTLSYRRDRLDSASIKYWLMPEMESLLKSGQIAAHFNTHVTEIRPGSALLENADGSHTQIPADSVLLLIGYEADMSLLRGAGVTLQPPGEVPQYNQQTMETNVRGLYVAGTAIAGTQQRYRVFLENCHVHVDRIVNAITGRNAPSTSVEYARPES